jgi:hypothetical protein
LTDEQQGGIAPTPEADASSEVPAPEETVATETIADEPAITETIAEPATPTEAEADRKSVV